MKKATKLLDKLYRKYCPSSAELCSASRTAEKPVVLYFSPHQDDELLAMGIDACNTAAKKEAQIHVVLCVDGSMSAVRERLGNGQTCPVHEGIHHYDFDIPKFVAARDREFHNSCRALGYQPGAIHLYPMRAIDGQLTVEFAQAIIKSTLLQFPKDTEVRTLSPYGGKKQHSDHRCLGQAAINLYNQGIIKKLRLFIEPYCLESCREDFPDLELIELRADENAKKHLSGAIAAYSDWDPENDSYAIGYHSVIGLFDDFMKDAKSYYHIPSKA